MSRSYVYLLSVYPNIQHKYLTDDSHYVLRWGYMARDTFDRQKGEYYRVK